MRQAELVVVGLTALLFLLTVRHLTRDWRARTLLGTSIVAFVIFIGFAEVAFQLPQYLEQFDRFGYGTLRASFGIEAQSDPALRLKVVLAYLAGAALLFAMAKSGDWATQRTPVLPRCDNLPFLFLLFFLAIAMLIPFQVLGEGAGFFWTTVLAYSSLLVGPLLLRSRRLTLGMLLFFVWAAAFLARGSKADGIYVVLAAMLCNLDLPRVHKAMLIPSVIFVAIALPVSMMLRDESDLTPYLLDIILLREYSLEMTGLALAAHQLEIGFSWVMFEMSSLIPSALLEVKFRPSNFAAFYFAPEDWQLVPDAGFYRSLLFPFIIDLGPLAGVIAGWALVYLYLAIIRRAGTRTSGLGVVTALPTILYMHWAVNGEWGGYLLHVVAGMITLGAISAIAAFFRARQDHEAQR